MPNIIELETDRLLLRQWRQTDYEAFAAINADEKVMAFFPKTLNCEESDTFAGWCRQSIDERGWGFWALELKSNGRFIGFTGLHIPGYQLPVAPCVEIGWRLGYPFWGYGYATEAAQSVLRTGFECLKLTEIISFTSLGNTKSQAVMQRLGMVRTNIEFDHPLVPEGSQHRRHCLFELTREQWVNLKMASSTQTD